MHSLYLTLCFCLLTPLLAAQVVIDSSSAPVVGDEWSVGIVNIDLADYPLPAVNTRDAVFNFTDIIPNRRRESFRIEAPPTEADLDNGEVLPELPGGTVVSLNSLVNLLFDIDEEPIPQFLVTRDSGVFEIGDAFYENGTYSEIDLDTVAQDLMLPFTLREVGDTLAYSYVRTSADSTTGDLDTVSSSRVFRYLYSGSLEMDFGTYPEVAVYLVTDTSRTVTVSAGSIVEFTNSTVALQFYRKQSFQPLLTLFLEQPPRTDGTLENSSADAIYYEPVQLSPVSGFVPELEFELYPNPTSGRLVLTLTERARGRVEVTLFTLDGRRVLGRSYGGRSAGAPLSLDLPPTLPVGNYILRVAHEAGLGSRMISIVR